jgi:hypothetical protein
LKKICFFCEKGWQTKSCWGCSAWVEAVVMWEEWWKRQYSYYPLQ